MKTKPMVACAILLTLTTSSAWAKYLVGPTPEEKQAMAQSSSLLDQARGFLRAGDYQAAEYNFRQAAEIDTQNDAARSGLAEALAAQGKEKEALEVYQNLFIQDPSNLSSVTQDVRTLMPYAALLCRAGRWPEAVAVYDRMPYRLRKEFPELNARFDPTQPMPRQLESLADIASGVEHINYGQGVEAFRDFGRAVRASPDSAVANYRYGLSWRSLTPRDKARSGRAASARTALQRAIALGGGDLKASAEKALAQMNQPK